ncbi:hypothetical protein SDC9_04133 [bioreactor metagenome]|uniref:Phage tail protein n=1 Tax=bioreactor metagenome TaxID=1076179 RepID=A0A644SV89_9ZZZZ|nr:phage tail protein [Negativicutes bacterium]
MIGSYGDVVFETSANLIRTFNGFKRQATARTATHEIIGKKPVTEFIGPGLEQISFSMRLDASMGITPVDELARLRNMRDQGITAQLIVNDQPITDNEWLIESLSEDWTHIDNNGRLVIANVDIALKEYVLPEV